MTYRWDETWHRLREWTSGQAPSERLAAQILLDEGYKNLDPIHPLGGRDGRKDAICTKDGKKWVMGVYFPRGQQRFKDIKSKFVDDLEGVKLNNADALAFVTNQEILNAEREEFQKIAKGIPVELFHLERITAIVDKPAMYGVRQQFLGIGFQKTPTEIRFGEDPALEKKEYEINQVNKRAILSLVGLNFSLVVLAFVALNRTKFTLLGFYTQYISIAFFVIAIIFMFVNRGYIYIFLNRKKLKIEDGCIDGNRFIRHISDDRYESYGISANCSYPDCDGKVYLVPPPKKEQGFRQFIGECSKGGKEHTYRVDANWVGYPHLFDWSKEKEPRGNL